MPLYEYQCRECERRFEVLQRMGAGPDGLECPACGSAGIERALSTFACASSGADGSGGGACAPSRAFS